jgi:outer membrane protein assembly factor BamB
MMLKRFLVLFVVAALATVVVLNLRSQKEEWRPLERSEIDRPEQLDDLHTDLGDLDSEAWVRMYLPNNASPGFNLGFYRRRIPIIFDMDGRIVHAWPKVRAIGRVRLNREGRLAVIGIDNLVKEYDWDGNLTWYFQLPDEHHFPHHDLITLKNGNYLILGYDGHTHTDYLWEVNADRQVVWEWWMYDHRQSFSGWDEESTDPSHCNSIRELPLNRWFDAGDERFRPGNILVSARNLNTIFIIDKVTGDVVWQYSKDFDHQHEAVMVERGRFADGLVVVFNNGLENLHAYRRSLVQAIDPVSEQVTWEYGSELFFAYVGGTAQPLPGKNILITSGNGGRTFEITPDGRIVWEWVPSFNPMRVERVPYDHCPQLAALTPAEGDNVRRRARRPYVDTGLYRFDFRFDTEERVVNGKKRRLLRSNEGCRTLLIPPRATVKAGFGIDGESLGDRYLKATFRMTIKGEDGVQTLIDETLASDAERLWFQRRAPLGAYAYEHVKLCIVTVVEGETDDLGELAVWANPAIDSKSQRPAKPRTEHRITEQERKLREQQLKALGYVQ